jgi:integrase
MVTRMTGPWRHPNGVYYFRKAVPLSLRPALGGKAEVRVSLRTRDLAAAKLVYLEVAAEQQRAWGEAHAASVRPGPVPLALNNKQVHGLAGEMYREIVAEHEAEPGRPEKWTQALRAMQMALPPDQRETGGKRLMDFKVPAGHVAVRRFGPEVDAFLARRGIAVDRDTRYRLAGAAATAISQAGKHLRRNAGGDYSPDTQAARFPPVDLPARPASLKVGALFELWKEEHKPKDKTAKRYLGVMNALARFLGHDDVLAITEEDMFRWKDHRMKSGIDHGTIRRIDLAVPRSIFGWASKGKQHMPSNPVKDVTIAVRPKGKTRERGYTFVEAGQVLRATLVDYGGRFSPERAASRRWVPWLCAYSGARVNEVTQLLADDIYAEPLPDGSSVWVMKITPESGSVKTDIYRVVPLHPDIVEQGFLDYVRTRAGKPLFYDPSRARGGNPAHRQSDKTGERLAEWIRTDVGLKDKRIMPNHAWRHRFRSVSRSLKIPADVVNALDGHAAASVADTYGDFWPRVLHEAICLYPRYDLSAAQDTTAR